MDAIQHISVTADGSYTITVSQEDGSRDITFKCKPTQRVSLLNKHLTNRGGYHARLTYQGSDIEESMTLYEVALFVCTQQHDV